MCGLFIRWLLESELQAADPGGAGTGGNWHSKGNTRFCWDLEGLGICQDYPVSWASH